MKPKAMRLIAAPYTPLHPDGELHLAAVEEQAELLADNGASGAFVCGTTGESMSLSLAERMQLAEAWLRAAAGRFPVIVHVGHTCLADAQALAVHAARHGAAATAAMAPCFAKPADAEALVAFCAPIAAATSELPFYFYHIPGMTGVSLSMTGFMRLAGERIPNLTGLKYSHDDMVDLAGCLALDDGRYEILFGKDEILLTALALGVRGAVGSTYNFMTPLYARLVAAFDAGDLAAARQEQQRSMELVSTLFKFGPAAFAAGKRLMHHLGVDCGPVRPPLRPLSPQQCGQLEAELARIGFFTYCSKTSAAPRPAKPAPAVKTATV